jgi:hypothetical protein
MENRRPDNLRGMVLLVPGVDPFSTSDQVHQTCYRHFIQNQIHQTQSLPLDRHHDFSIRTQ